MRSRILIMMIIFIAGYTSLPAKDINVVQARKVAGNFLHQVHLQYGSGKDADNILMGDPYIYIQDGAPVFYAFNTDPGFIIISGDDVFTPVLGYSFEGRFQLEGAPSHYRGFIQNYIDQILYIRDHDLVADQDITATWKELSADDISAVQPMRDDREVTPLLSSLWDQGTPFNLLCPEDPAGPGGHVWVGCVATAMAQVMYYWRYPEVGTGSHCYWADGYGEQCAEFGETYYNWEGMKNSIDVENPYPNAELQYQCAVSVDMMFSPNGSGAYSSDVPGSIAQYFGYTDAQYLDKESYSLSQWITILKDELNLGHPMYYSGFTTSWSGHAFVCDGYQGDNFHFNFGWSGSSNGYYSLYNVGGFSEYQACVMNYVPSDPAYPYLVTGDILITQKSGSITDGSGPVDDYTNNQQATWLIDSQSLGDSITDISLKFNKFDLLEGDTLKVYDGGTIDDPLLGSYSGHDIPETIKTTGHKMLITFATDGSGTSSGFYAEYKANSAVFCSGITELTEPYGNIEDGSGGFNYRNNSYCRWMIKPPFANTITLTFNQFETQDQYDFMAIFDGNTQVGQFSGDVIPEPVVAVNGSLFIIWYTNSNTNLQGWDLSYEVDNIGIQENSPVHSLDIYPNPAIDKLNVLFESEIDETVSVRLVSLTGKVVLGEVIENLAGNYHSVLDVKELPDGMYFLELESASSKLVKKVVIR